MSEFGSSHSHLILLSLIKSEISFWWSDSFDAKYLVQLLFWFCAYFITYFSMRIIPKKNVYVKAKTTFSFRLTIELYAPPSTLREKFYVPNVISRPSSATRWIFNASEWSFKPFLDKQRPSLLDTNKHVHIKWNPRRFNQKQNLKLQSKLQSLQSVLGKSRGNCLPNL